MAIVCLTGAPGTGKSTVSTELESRGWRIIRAGDLLRAEAARRGVDITEMNKHASLDGGIDRAIDLATRNIDVGPNERVVIEARMGFAFVPQDLANLTVLLACDDEIAGLRVHDASRADEPYRSPDEAIAALRERRRLEAERYRAIYGLSYDDVVADLVFETTQTPPDEIADVIEEHSHALEEDTALGVIGRFRDEFGWLSNMYPCPCSITLSGVEYTCGCAETAYQLQKTSNQELRSQMAGMDGFKAKEFASTLDTRPDWSRVRYRAMVRALEAKYFQNEDLARKLAETRGYALVEHNDWHDNWFGSCTCPECREKPAPALNMLGRMLMVVRQRLDGTGR